MDSPRLTCGYLSVRTEIVIDEESTNPTADPTRFNDHLNLPPGHHRYQHSLGEILCPPFAHICG